MEPYTVKKLRNILFSTFILLQTEGYTQIETADIGPQSIIPEGYEEGGEATPGPFTIAVFADWVSRADVERNWSGIKTVEFAASEVQANMVFYYDPCIKEGASVSLDFQRTYMNARRNPYFNEKWIDTISVVLGAATERVCNWIWRGQLSVNFDNIEYWNFNDYMYYDLLAWGRYEYLPNFGVHIGFIGQTGMKIDRFYPIIGIDYTFDCHWKINLVYPVNISLIYTYSPELSIALAARVFDERHRIKESATFLSEGLWTYRMAGAEFDITYNPWTWISANIHAGVTTGGILKIADRHYNHRKRFHIDPSGYVGADLKLNF